MFGVSTVVGLFSFLFGRLIQAKSVHFKLVEFKDRLKDQLHENEVQRRMAIYRAEVDQFIEKLHQESIQLPSLGRMADLVSERTDEILCSGLLEKARPAVKAEQAVRFAKKEARQARVELNAVRNQLDMMISVAPWLRDYTELTVEEILEGLRSHEGTATESAESEADEPFVDSKIVRWVPVHEWKDLSKAERLQLALDRYSDPSRSITPWDAGIRFERYVGYLYETKGYKVDFHGVLKGLEDLGVDLICESDKEIVVIQCKRLSPKKSIPVRENTVSQIYGATKYLAMRRKWSKPVVASVITTFELSETAREFADLLGVERQERMSFEKYPLIKCNIGSTGDKIYHLPFDQQYDSIVIGDVNGELYANDIAEAEGLGFRHAYRWRGSKD